MTVGFVGIGTMGQPMAGWIAKGGFPLAVHDLNRDAAAAFAAEHGARVCATGSEVGAASDVVITMLPTGSDVHAAAMGPDGIASGMATGSVLIDMSSSAPMGTVHLAGELAKHDIEMIDAPVSGGLGKAKDGTLTLMVGGDDSVIDRCLPVLETMSATIFRTGPIGSGHASKAVNNLLNAIGMAAATETLLIGRKFGLDPTTLVEVINASTGMNHATVNKMRQFVYPRTFNSHFAMDLMIKDMDTALDFARTTGTPTPLSDLCRSIWGDAREALGPGLDQTAVARWIEQQAGAELRDDD